MIEISQTAATLAGAALALLLAAGGAMLFVGLRARSRAGQLSDANARLLALAAGSPALAMIVRADGRIELSIALANLFGFDAVPAHFSDLIDNDAVLAPEDARALDQEV
ncbi:MAG: histidine kinase, partial [Sphingomonadales bacterium]